MSYPEAQSSEAAERFEKEIKPFLAKQLEESMRFYYDSSADISAQITYLMDRWGRDSTDFETWRFNLLRSIAGGDLSGLSILDMSAGCGSFVLEGLSSGLDVWGVEPEPWKLELVEMKCVCYGLPSEWKERVKEGVGEQLPFEEGKFDFVVSHQTLEHVQDQSACLCEFYRVLKPGGVAVVNFPSYASFWEAHYLIPWLPYLGGIPARLWVRILGRPTMGLSYFSTTTGRAVRRKARRAGFTVMDLEVLMFRQRFRRRIAAASWPPIAAAAVCAYRIKRLAGHLARAFRVEPSVRLLLVKPSFEQGPAAAFIADSGVT